MIRRALDGLDNLAKEKGIKLETVLPPVAPRVHGSAQRLQQVVTNLVNNAIAYTNKGQVMVKVSEDNGNVKVEVMDSGIGIPSEDLPRLFEDFFRASNVSGERDRVGTVNIQKDHRSSRGQNLGREPMPRDQEGQQIHLHPAQENRSAGQGQAMGTLAGPAEPAI